jgi:GNAT superfamily N-acetyltransferase
VTRDGAALADPYHVVGGGWSREVKLRDGTRVLLRQIRAEDRPLLVEGLERLSPASRYLRFHRVVEELTEKELDELTVIDHVDHEAIVALDRSRPDHPGFGVARYLREPYEPEVAEAAVTVLDEYHGQGAGTLLLGALASRALENGVRVFRNYVLDGNDAMLEVFDHLGATRELDAGMWRVDLPLPEHEDDLPDSPAGRAFLAAARGRRRLSSLFPPIWGRREAHGEGGHAGGGTDDGVADGPAGSNADEPGDGGTPGRG